MSKQTQNRFKRVPEFAFLIKEANRIGVKVYLFGGTASSFAHYVRWDLEREAGDNKYQKERFDYDFTNIYRENQDLDIVVDGTAVQADQLKLALEKEYPHFIGNKDAWEVRLLREQRGDKLPLLDNYDFMNQHTDSSSTGLLALNSAKGEIVYRDLLDWENKKSRFLKDAAAGKIHFIYNSKHRTTSRYIEGKNPPILAAIRYIAKLTQYDVEAEQNDIETVQKIIQTTSSGVFTPYVKFKAFEFALKALLNSADVEYAWNILEETGLRSFLMDLDEHDASVPESLSWWFNKEPLRSFEIAQGNGRTALEIFNSKGIILSHTTNSFSAYDNITRSAQGKLNVFISRQGDGGELARHGDGFYTMLGEEGLWETGLNVRFLLNPNAREGTDFTLHDNYVLIKNKNAIRLIQDDLRISPIDVLRLIKEGEITAQDQGLIEKFNRKFMRMKKNDPAYKKAFSFVQSEYHIADDLPEELKFDFSKFDASHENLFKFYLQERDKYYEFLIDKFSKMKNEQIKEEWVQALLDKNHDKLNDYIVSKILTKKYWKDHPDWVKTLIERGYNESTLAFIALSKEHWSGHPELVDQLIEKGKAFHNIARWVVGQSKKWRRYPKLIEKLIEYGKTEDHDHFKNVDKQLARYVLIHPQFKKHPYLVEMLIKKGTVDKELAEFVLEEPHWGKYPHLVSMLIEKGTVDEEIAVTLYKSQWSKYPELVLSLIEKGKEEVDSNLAIYTLSESHWSAHPELVLELVKKGTVDKYIREHILSEPYWKNHPELKKYLNGNSVTVTNLRKQMKSKPFKKTHKKSHEKLQKKGMTCNQYLH